MSGCRKVRRIIGMDDSLTPVIRQQIPICFEQAGGIFNVLVCANAVTSEKPRASTTILVWFSIINLEPFDAWNDNFHFAIWNSTTAPPAAAK